MLDICGLSPFIEWPISALSYGQKKRVTIASILVLRPNILILDEPTAGQDYRHYSEIMEFLRHINESGVSIILANYVPGRREEYQAYYENVHSVEVINVPGATGYYDTDYAGKARAAIKSLEKNDFVFVHVEAPDEAGHNGDLDQKIRAIENFDRFVVGPVMRRLGDVPHSRLMVLPDHPTPIRVRTHTGDPVPFAWCGQGIAASGAGAFSEREAAGSRLQVQEGYTLMGRFIHGEKLVE